MSDPRAGESSEHPASPDHADEAVTEVVTTEVGDAEQAQAAVADAGSVTVVGPHERNELLESNRRNREQERDRVEAKQRKDEEKAAKRAAKTSEPREPVTVAVRRSALIAAAVVLVLLLGGVGTLTYLYLHERNDTPQQPGLVAGALSADTPAVTAATEYTEAVLTYNWGDYADLDRRIREISTPEFADLFIAESQEPRKASDGVQASATVDVVEAGLISQTDDEAEVLVAIDRTITSPQLASIPEGDRSQGRIRVSLTKSDDRWLLSGIRNV